LISVPIVAGGNCEEDVQCGGFDDWCIPLEGLEQRFEQRFAALEARLERRNLESSNDSTPLRETPHPAPPRESTTPRESTPPPSEVTPQPQRESTPPRQYTPSIPIQGIELKTVHPSRFSGKNSEFLNFMMQCEVTFEMYPNTYPTDELKVLFIINNLDGNALRWARDIFGDPVHPLRSNYAAFRQALYDMYDDHSYQIKAEEQLTSLRQTKSASAYAVEFQTLAAPLNYNDNALCGFFYQGLKPEVKMAIITQGRATNLSSLIVQAIQFDQHQHQLQNDDKQSYARNRPRPNGTLAQSHQIRLMCT
jgi:hypothetical protein